MQIINKPKKTNNVNIHNNIASIKYLKIQENRHIKEQVERTANIEPDLPHSSKQRHFKKRFVKVDEDDCFFKVVLKNKIKISVYDFGSQKNSKVHKIY